MSEHQSDSAYFKSGDRVWVDFGGAGAMECFLNELKPWGIVTYHTDPQGTSYHILTPWHQVMNIQKA